MNENSPKTPRVAACLLAYNESQVIGRAIESVRPHVDEVVVLDMGSRDLTVGVVRQLAERDGAPIYVHLAGPELAHAVYDDGDIADMAAARNCSFALASPEVEWLLWLDPDEEVRGDTDLHELIADARPYVDAFQIAHETSAGTAGRDRPRVVRRERLTWRYRMHEQLVPVGDDLRDYDAETRWAKVDRDRLRVVHLPGDEAGEEDVWKLRVLRDVEREAIARHAEPDPHCLYFLGQGIKGVAPDLALTYFVRALTRPAAVPYSYLALGEISNILRGRNDPWVSLLVDALGLTLWPTAAAMARVAESFHVLGWTERAERAAQRALAMAAGDPRQLDTSSALDGSAALALQSLLQELAANQPSTERTSSGSTE